MTKIDPSSILSELTDIYKECRRIHAEKKDELIQRAVNIACADKTTRQHTASLIKANTEMICNETFASKIEKVTMLIQELIQDETTERTSTE